MPVENDFLYYAIVGSPNVVSQATYAAASYIGPGLGSGILASAVYNKMIRQGTAGAAILAQFIVNQLNENVLDNGSLTTLVTQLTAAIQQSATQKPGRVVTTSATVTMLLTDFWVGVDNTSGGALAIDLPTGPAIGQQFQVEDWGGNASNAEPLNVTAPAGTTFKNGKTVLAITENYGGVVVTYGATNTWGFRF